MEKSEQSLKESDQSYRINITNPVYCEVVSDTKEKTTYGTVKSMGEAQEIQVTSSVASGKLFGNGALVDAISLLTGFTVSMNLTKLKVEVVADIYNNTVTDGVVQVKAGTTPKQIAMGYEVPQTNGKSEYVWLLKGSPRPRNFTVKQSEDNINYSTDTIEIDFVKRNSDDMFKYFADESYPDFTEEQAEVWFKEGPSTFPKKPVKPDETQGTVGESDGSGQEEES